MRSDISKSPSRTSSSADVIHAFQGNVVPLVKHTPPARPTTWQWASVPQKMLDTVVTRIARQAANCKEDAAAYAQSLIR